MSEWLSVWAVWGVAAAGAHLFGGLASRSEG